MGDIDIRTKLTLDDRASAALSQIKAGFKGTAAAAGEAQAGSSAFKGMLGTMAAMNVVPMVNSVYSFGKSFMDAAMHARSTYTSVAALMMVSQGSKWSESIANAEKYGAEMQTIAINSGVAADSVKGAFRHLLSLSGATKEGVEAARVQIGQMSTVAGVMGMDVEAVATEFGFMEEGVLRTKGQLFQLLQTTGIFGENTKKAASYWATLTESDRHRLLGEGLGKMNAELSKVPMSMGRTITSAKETYASLKEAIGTPIMQALVPEIKNMVGSVKVYRHEIEAFAKSMAVDVGKWAKEASVAIRDAFKWVSGHQEEIKNAIVEGWKYAKGVAEFIVAHKTEIAILYGAKMAAPMVSSGASMAKGVMGVAASGVPALGMAGAGAGAVAGAAALGAFALAIAGVGLAAWQAKELIDSGGTTSEEHKNAKAVAEMFANMRNDQTRMMRQWTAEEVAAYDERRAAMVRWAEQSGLNARAMGEVADATWQAHRAARAQVEQFDRMSEVFANLKKAGADLTQVDMGPAVEKLSAGFGGAVNTHNEAVAVYIANVLVKNKELQAAFLNSTAMTGDAMDALAAMIRGKSTELDALADSLSASTSRDKAAGGASKPAAPKVSIGSATFKIEQNFRDQDPDRVAIVFERDITRAVENRLQAVSASPFGT